MTIFKLIFNSILLGVGLAMDAFSVSVANGLKEPHMVNPKRLRIAGVFAVFQFAMPMLGWLCVSFAASRLWIFQKLTPWIALALLLFLGIKMIVDAVRRNALKGDGEAEEKVGTGWGTLLLQGVATSIDALSVGFVIADYRWADALVSTLIIGAVTFGICIAGILLGRKFGEKLKNRAEIAGGIILIIIGLEIFITSLF
ncbi:MAG: manganese efflux pump [Clostridia bacterium]|nr:manganese efflux pump [Clostridia bacterium]